MHARLKLNKQLLTAVVKPVSAHTYRHPDEVHFPGARRQL